MILDSVSSSTSVFPVSTNESCSVECSFYHNRFKRTSLTPDHVAEGWDVSSYMACWLYILPIWINIDYIFIGITTGMIRFRTCGAVSVLWHSHHWSGKQIIVVWNVRCGITNVESEMGHLTYECGYVICEIWDLRCQAWYRSFEIWDLRGKICLVPFRHKDLTTY